VKGTKNRANIIGITMLWWQHNIANDTTATEIRNKKQKLQK